MQYGLIAALNSQEAEQQQQDRLKDREKRADEAENEPEGKHDRLVGKLDAYISRAWEAAKTAKMEMEREMLNDLRQREGKYDPSKLQAIREQGGSEIYMMLTNMKCRAAESWLADIVFPAGERPFGVKPSPIPDMPPEIMQLVSEEVARQASAAMQAGMQISEEMIFQRAQQVGREIKHRISEIAKRRAKGMEDAIDEVFINGDWYEAMHDFIADLSTHKTAILKGPVFRNKRKIEWKQIDGTLKWTPKVQQELTPQFYSPSPLDIYPAPDSTGPQDGYLIERIRTRRAKIYDMIGVPGYKESAIRAALEEYERHGLNLDMPMEQQRRELENSRHWQLSPDQGIDMLEFHGPASGRVLREWGMSPKEIPDVDAEYEISAIKVGRFIIKCVLNEDPMRQRPYMAASFDRVKGQFWGRSLPSIIRDLQDICNATARALVNNMGLASGPMVEVEVDRLAEGEEVTQVFPWKVYQTKSSGVNSPSPAVRFNQPDIVANALLSVYRFFMGLADVYSGIPAYEHGVNPTAGAGGTASGLSMLMSAASRQIKQVASSIDKVTVGACRRVHTYVMLYGTDPSVKGDADIQPRASQSIMAREQMSMRLGQIAQATANPIDAQIMGAKGRMNLLREEFKSLGIDPDNILPDKFEAEIEDVMRKQAQEAQQQAQQQALEQGQSEGQQPPDGGPPGAAQAPPANNQPQSPPAVTPSGDPQGGAHANLFAMQH